jgi:hypothetical protein
VLKPINEHKSSFSRCMKPNVWTQKVMAKPMVIGHLVNTYRAFGYGFCLETGWFYPNSPKKKNCACVTCSSGWRSWKAVETDKCIKKTCHPRGFNEFIPKISWASASLKERSHSSSSMTDRQKDLRTMGRGEQRDQSSSSYPSLTCLSRIFCGQVHMHII